MDDPFLGRQIGSYEIRAQLGVGGMARVYRAFDHQLHREVALKILAEDAQRIPNVAERFLREARTLASLQHRGIVPIYTVGEYEGLPYLVQELLPGPTLEDEMTALQRQDSFMADEEIQRTIHQLAGALDYAHRRGIIHRDLKPSNCLRNQRGELVLVDFGIARAIANSEKLTRTGLVMGTPHYLAPEQAMGQTLTPAVDIYALGVMLFELLTNKLPFDDTSSVAIALAHVNQTPPPPRSLRPELPLAAEDVVMKALAKDPRYRYDSAGALAAALAAAWKQSETVHHVAQATLNPALVARHNQGSKHDEQTTVNPALAGVARPPVSARAAQGARAAGPSQPAPVQQPAAQGRLWLYVAILAFVLLAAVLLLRGGDSGAPAGSNIPTRTLNEQLHAGAPTVGFMVGPIVKTANRPK